LLFLQKLNELLTKKRKNTFSTIQYNTISLLALINHVNNKHGEIHDIVIIIKWYENSNGGMVGGGGQDPLLQSIAYQFKYETTCQ
jgi:hypothetical protein